MRGTTTLEMAFSWTVQVLRSTTQQSPSIDVKKEKKSIGSAAIITTLLKLRMAIFVQGALVKGVPFSNN